MATHAFQETYLNKAQALLGEAFDFASYALRMDVESFLKLFIASTVSKKLENGDPSVLFGKSGAEMVVDILQETKGTTTDVDEWSFFARSKEYWVGWALAYYQYRSGKTYQSILEVVPYKNLLSMYETHHEADISKFVETLNEQFRKVNKPTNLKQARLLKGYSQATLAQESGVSLRSIQMYEQRNKDINKASAETLYRLSKSLGCNIEDLLEK